MFFCFVFKASALWADAFIELRCQYICLFVYLSPFMLFFLRPLIGPHVTWSDPGVSLAETPPPPKKNQATSKNFWQINHATSPKFYRSYYPHWSIDSLSLVRGIFCRRSILHNQSKVSKKWLKKILKFRI